ncbi:hypothetical protein FQZ97_1055210 [compost metagenome]
MLEIRHGVADLLRRVLGSHGQFADLIGNYRKTTTLLTGSGCFDTRVQRQKVCLLSNPFDDVHHQVDSFCLVLELFERANRLVQACRQFLHAAGGLRTLLTAFLSQRTSVA